MNPLLYSIIDQLNDIRKANEITKRDTCGKSSPEIRVDYIDAVFFKGKQRKPFATLGVIHAMDSLANDVFLFEEFDISEANRVELRRQ